MAEYIWQQSAWSGDPTPQFLWQSDVLDEPLRRLQSDLCTDPGAHRLTGANSHPQ